MLARFFALLLLFGVAALAQSPGPALAVDAAAGRHPINPGIYGINWDWTGETASSQSTAAAAATGATVRRWGGNNTTRYHWKFDVMNIDSDWFFEVLPDSAIDASQLPEGSSFNTAFERWQRGGAQVMGTVPILDWLPKARARMCSFSVRKYGRQCTYDPYWNDCGTGIAWQSGCPTPSPANPGNGYTPPSNAQYIQNDPNDANALFDESFQRDWVRYVVSKYGAASRGGVRYWSLDNEPDWWQSTHRDIHPSPQTYDDTLSRGLRYARAVKDADPTALVTGPVVSGWQSLFLSFSDIRQGWNTGPLYYWFSNQSDRHAHDGLALVPWYLQQFREAEKNEGRRLLDVLDVHAYISPDRLDQNPGSPDIQALRMQSTRALWDPNYLYNAPGSNVKNYWIVDPDVTDKVTPIAPALIPRLRAWIDQYYPGTQLAITEYNWGALDNINGGLAQADILGIFGREGVDIGTLWGSVAPTDPGAMAFKIYRNYDGIGGAFGDTSVQASTANPDQLSVFAALRSDSSLTVMVINKTAADLSSSLALSNFTAAGSAMVWRYSAANLAAIVQQPDAPVSANALAATFPANSMTMLVIPPAISAAPQPTVQTVANAASYDSTKVAPGEIVIIGGVNIGPSRPSPQVLVDSSVMLRDTLSDTRVLFDGVPARLLYASATQINAIVPYTAALNASTHVQVERRGVRGAAITVPVEATAPGLFTLNQGGTGQAIAQVEGGALNSPAYPAHPGSAVTFWLTGEGATDPPGVDGRVALNILPKPAAGVTVQIGGKPATVVSVGALPGAMPGLTHVTAQLAPDVAAGDAVPVQIQIGANSTQSGVTIVVR